MIGTWAVVLLLADLGRDLVAVELREHHVEEDERGLLGAPQLESFGAVAGDEDLVALLLERVGQDPLDVRVVVDDEDLGRHALPWSGGVGAASQVPPPIIGTAGQRAGHGTVGTGVRSRLTAVIEQVEHEPAPRLEPVADRPHRASRGEPAGQLVGLADGDRAATGIGHEDDPEVDPADLGRVVVEQTDEPVVGLEVGRQLLAPLAGQPAVDVAVARVEVTADPDRPSARGAGCRPRPGSAA